MKRLRDRWMAKIEKAANFPHGIASTREWRTRFRPVQPAGPAPRLHPLPWPLRRSAAVAEVR